MKTTSKSPSGRQCVTTKQVLLSMMVFGTAMLIALLFYTDMYGNIGTIKSVEKKPIILDWTGNNRNDFKEHMVDNCLVTRNRSLLLKSHAVVFTHREEKRIQNFPKSRQSWQKWVWLNDESQRNSFRNLNYDFKSIRNTYNWTMTFKTSSDVYIPYGWTTQLETPMEVPDYFGNRTKKVISLISNCWTHNDRLKYVKELQKFISIDMFGKCTGKKCKGHVGYNYNFNCEHAKNYLFYLAFENTNCKEYITEKAFAHGFSMGTVPVVMGAPKADYLAITPPNSFIHVRDFSGPAELGKYLTFLSNNSIEYMKYHEWRRHYTTSYRVQYVTDEPLWTSLCRALNKNTQQTKTYEDLGAFWPENDCE